MQPKVHINSSLMRWITILDAQSTDGHESYEVIVYAQNHRIALY